MVFYARYSNSFLATFLSFLGSCIVLMGVLFLISGLGFGPSVAAIAIGALLMFSAKKISESKAEREARKNR